MHRTGGHAMHNIVNSRSWRRMSVRDRGWLGTDVIRAVGPLARPTAASLREALATTHSADPSSHFVCRIDREHARWVPMSGSEFAASLPEVVSEIDSPEPASTD